MTTRRACVSGPQKTRLSSVRNPKSNLGSAYGVGSPTNPSLSVPIGASGQPYGPRFALANLRAYSARSMRTLARVWRANLRAFTGRLGALLGFADTVPLV